MLSVVVTGAAGFIGRVVVERLAAAGQRVVAVDRRTQPSRPGVTAVTADLLAGEDRVDSALRDASAVVHLAGCPGVRDSAPDVEARRERDNVRATARVASLVPADVPLLVTSSSSVYGGVRHGRACRENDAVRPLGGYARSKRRVEQLCAARADAGGHVLVVRPFTVVGEGQRPDMALARWVDATLAGRPLTVLGSVDRTRDLTCVREVARGLVRLLESGATGVVNIGSGRPRRLAEMIDVVGDVVGSRPALLVKRAAAEEARDTWADVRRFAQLTGFVPHTDLHDVVRRVLAERSAVRCAEAVVA